MKMIMTAAKLMMLWTGYVLLFTKNCLAFAPPPVSSLYRISLTRERSSSSESNFPVSHAAAAQVKGDGDYYAENEIINGQKENENGQGPTVRTWPEVLLTSLSENDVETGTEGTDKVDTQVLKRTSSEIVRWREPRSNDLSFLFDKQEEGSKDKDAHVITEEKDILSLDKDDKTIALSSTTTNTESSSEVKTRLSTWARIRRLRQSLLSYDATYTILSSSLIGILTGFAVAVFKLSIEGLRELLYGTSFSEHFYWWLIPALGGLAVGLLRLTGEFSPGLRGTASEVDEDSIFTNRDERFAKPLRFLRKPLAAVLTLGSGCSLGPEGPSVEIGMTFSRLGMPPSIETTSAVGSDEEKAAIARVRRNRLLLSAGAAAGVSAGFNAPLSGVFFALEIVQQNFPALALPEPGSTEANPKTKLQKIQQDYFVNGSASITAILLASILSALVAKTYLGDHLALNVPKYNLNAPLVELPLYMLLGVTTGGVAGTFTALAQFCKRVFDGEGGPKPLRVIMKMLPSWTKPALGGLFCGVVALVYPQILFFGYETLNNLLSKRAMAVTLLLQLLVIKTISTAVSAGSGLVGGTFAPALFLGGMTGAAFHNIAERLLSIGANNGPFVLADVQAYALVGSAGVLSALFRAPLTASLILFELTRDYGVILPLMATASVGSVVGDAVEKALDEKRRDRDAVSWGDLADEGDDESDEPRKKGDI